MRAQGPDGRVGDTVGNQSGRQQSWLSWGLASILDEEGLPGQATALWSPGPPSGFSLCIAAFRMFSCNQVSEQDTGPYTQLLQGPLFQTPCPSSSLSPHSMDIQESTECSTSPNLRTKVGALGAPSAAPPTSPWDPDGPLSLPETALLCGAGEGLDQ